MRVAVGKYGAELLRAQEFHLKRRLCWAAARIVTVELRPIKHFYAHGTLVRLCKAPLKSDATDIVTCVV